MESSAESIQERIQKRTLRLLLRGAMSPVLRVAAISAIALAGFYVSLISSSDAVSYEEMVRINESIRIIESKGFAREAALLRTVASFRRSDNWLNRRISKENAYAATNCPFGVITVYPDFFVKAQDDTERAMILLHEAQHLIGSDETTAYTFVWRNRQKLGWTQLSYGTTPTYVTIELLTREHAPNLFDCADKRWSDCTELLRASR